MLILKKTDIELITGTNIDYSKFESSKDAETLEPILLIKDNKNLLNLLNEIYKIGFEKGEKIEKERLAQIELDSIWWFEMNVAKIYIEDLCLEDSIRDLIAEFSKKKEDINKERKDWTSLNSKHSKKEIFKQLRK